MSSTLSSLPTLYETLLPQVFHAALPSEAKAACSSCVMCSSADAPLVEQTPGFTLFNPKTKCCTYHPKLPNYLVGALLAERGPSLVAAEGQRRVRAKIAARVAATPQWLKAPAKYDLVYKSTTAGFGRSAALRCPYYESDSGACTIWTYREAVCSTFFCKHVGGADGRSYWMSVKRYLSLAEIQLSRHALLQHFPEWVLRQGDTPRSGADSLTLTDLDDDGRSLEDHRADWGPWAGREEELYIRCYETVRALTAEELARILGLDGDVHAAVLERLRLAVVEPHLPEKPRLNPGLSVRHLDDGSVAVAFHSEYDALALPAAAWRLLAEFRGTETLAGVRGRLREEHGADFSDEILTELHRHRVLI